MSGNDLDRFKRRIIVILIGFWMANVTYSALPAVDYTPPIYVHWFCGAAVMTVFGLERIGKWWRGGGPDAG